MLKPLANEMVLNTFLQGVIACCLQRPATCSRLHLPLCVRFLFIDIPAELGHPSLGVSTHSSSSTSYFLGALIYTNFNSIDIFHMVIERSISGGHTIRSFILGH